MDEIVIFIVSYLFIFVIYELFIVNKAKKNNKYIPIEVKYIVKKYKIDIDNINYIGLLHMIAISSSFNIAVVSLIFSVVKNVILNIVLSVISLVLLTIITYSLIGKSYSRRIK